VKQKQRGSQFCYVTRNKLSAIANSIARREINVARPEFLFRDTKRKLRHPTIRCASRNKISAGATFVSRRETELPNAQGF
jgi:hypothetical protein